MSKRVTLREVTADNWEEVADLEVHEHQEEFLEDNVWSIAESKFNKNAVPRAIYAGKHPVGFIMWESLAGEGAPHDYFIFRFMIDRRHQGKGYGRLGMELALGEIRKDRRLSRITICYVPENAAARDFYASFGFRETGIDEDGEMIAEIVA
jgi:diamine N-acetyltransferase